VGSRKVLQGTGYVVVLLAHYRMAGLPFPGASPRGVVEAGLW